MACLSRFLSCRGEKYPNPKSGQDRAPEVEVKQFQIFACFFSGFWSLLPHFSALEL